MLRRRAPKHAQNRHDYTKTGIMNGKIDSRKLQHSIIEVLTAVFMKSSIYWDIMTCSPLKSTHVSEEYVTSIFRVEKAELCLPPASRWFLAWLILRPWRLRRYVLPKRRLTFNGLHGVTSQKIELFKYQKHISLALCILGTWTASVV
jgi:hypothetical protein